MGHAVDQQRAHDPCLHEADARGRERNRREQCRGEGYEDRCADPEVRLRQVQRVDHEIDAGSLEQPDRTGHDDDDWKR